MAWYTFRTASLLQAFISAFGGERFAQRSFLALYQIKRIFEPPGELNFLNVFAVLLERIQDHLGAFRRAAGCAGGDLTPLFPKIFLVHPSDF
jgi:hypothetical protein